MNNDTDNLKKKLIYRSQYRGTKEMDKLIGNFVKANIDTLDNAQLIELEIFLDKDDDTLYKLYSLLPFSFSCPHHSCFICHSAFGSSPLGS